MRIPYWENPKILKGCLDERERWVVGARLQGYTLQQIADSLDVSKETARRVEEKAWARFESRRFDYTRLNNGVRQTTIYHLGEPNTPGIVGESIATRLEELFTHPKTKKTESMDGYILRVTLEKRNPSF